VFDRNLRKYILLKTTPATKVAKSGNGSNNSFEEFKEM
jgi:hypothetical protein